MEYGIRNKYSFTNSHVSTKVSTVKAAYKELDFLAHAVQILIRRINSEKQANEFLTRIYYLALFLLYQNTLNSVKNSPE